jgi:hypothetical protein
MKPCRIGNVRGTQRRPADSPGPLLSPVPAEHIRLFSKDMQDAWLTWPYLIRTKAEGCATRPGQEDRGVLDPHNPPLSVGGIAAAPRDTADQPVGPLTPRGPSRVLTGTTRMRKARNQTFRKPLPEQGNRRCAFPGRRYQSPVAAQITGRPAAHVVAGACSGSDHPADGRLFSKTCIGPLPTPRRLLRHQRGGRPERCNGPSILPGPSSLAAALPRPERCRFRLRLAVRLRFRYSARWTWGGS